MGTGLSMVLPATEAEISQESEGNDDGIDTVPVADNVHDFNSEPKKSQEEFTLSTSASLPTPLFCPHRTFLASVILASMFSNHAWAKLLDFPAWTCS